MITEKQKLKIKKQIEQNREYAEELYKKLYDPIIPKEHLEHGIYYEGTCRNATIARWNDKEEVFYHWRYKYGYYIETIKCPEDEDHYDVFIAKTRLEGPPRDIIPFDLGA